MEGSLLEAVRCSDAQDVARILAAGADPNVPDELGETPIFEATATGHTNIVALLLMSRADPDYRSPQGMVARQMALEPTALLLDLCSGRRTDAESWEEAMAAVSAPLRGPFTRQFRVKGMEAPEETGEDQHPSVQDDMNPMEDEETAPTKGLPTPTQELPEATDANSPRDQDVSPDPKLVDTDIAADPPTEVPLDAGPVDEEDVAPEPVAPPEAEPTAVESPRNPEVGTAHVVLHSPMIAVRKEPCTRAVVVKYLRPGEKILLAEWDASHQWRRMADSDAWVPVRHPSLGVLCKAEGSEENDGKMSVTEAWRQLYEGGILNIPPPDGRNVSSITSQALVEAATTGKAQTIQGEKALASLDMATVEYVMTAALQHLQIN